MKREILIKFGELFLKGENKRKFEISLLDNIKKKIEKYGKFTIKQIRKAQFFTVPSKHPAVRIVTKLKISAS